MAKSAEFILELEAKQILVLEPLGPSYQEVTQRLSEQPDLQVVECGSVREVGSLARQVAVCVVLAHCADESQSAKFISLLEMLGQEIKSRKVRVILTVNNDFVFLQPRFIRRGAT